MKRKLIKIMIFILMVTLIAGVITYYLNWKHFQQYGHHHNLLKTKDNHPSVQVGSYKTVMNEKNVRYTAIDEYLKKQKFNGDIAIYYQGKLVMDKGYGYQDFINRKKTNPNSMYLIGSAQKFMTGMMLKKLETEGKLNINDEVTKYLPWFQTNEPLILRDFMLHQSGIQMFRPKTNIHSIDGAVHMLQEQGLQPDMFRKHQYNDANYIVLARVIEAVTKMSYADYFNQNFVQPYELNQTAFYNNTAYKPYMAKGYNELKIPEFPAYMDQYYGAGNLYMAPRDMGKFVLALQNQKMFNAHTTNQLLHEVNTKEFPHAYRYGFYSFGQSARANGIFYGQQFTCYFNKDYILVMGTNYQKPVGKNETLMKKIFMDYLKQPDPTKKAKQ
ncbi:methicillin resistance protein FmtA [Staphylococcus simulans]|uniref:serine hydrolase domain-containing protein n=1 Tax=Staphylococcus simulans TaxID=1286 RepID=UPI000D1E04A7|nr:serine hydrolase domain-containing protein [Staphylococcus simulans]PTI96990.1 methicillin resistance protein FmtA [Staphylococcus simulans]